MAPCVILTFTRPDYQALCRLVLADSPPRYLWDCPRRHGRWQGRHLTISGPAPGAPYAAMVLEKLITLGARLVLALSWCGSLQPHIGSGSLVLAERALGEDGTSRHYRPETELAPDPSLTALLRQGLTAGGTPWHAGAVLTTAAFYRETPGLVRHYASLGVLGVDLELAALFAVGRHRGVPVAGLAVVSDELASLTWRPGHRSPGFRQAREAAMQVVLTAAAQWEDGRD